MVKKNFDEKDINFIIESYTKRKIGTYRLAKYFNCSVIPIYRVLKENRIEIKPYGYFCREKPNPRKGLTKENDETSKKISEQIKKIKNSRGWKENVGKKLRIKQIERYSLKDKNGKSINNPFYGRNHSDAYKKKMSGLMKGVKKSKESILKSIETRKKLFKEGKIKIWNKGLTKEDNQSLMNTSKKMRGDRLTILREKNPNWRGGKSFEPYGLNFNKKFKKMIKERDGGCLLCNLSFEDLKLLKRRIHIHHINYDKQCNLQQNCITLCINCHSKTHFNRIQWTNFFQSLLNEKYAYKYSEDNKIILEIKNG